VDATRAQRLSYLEGTARARGYAWADRVAATRPELLGQPWPPFEGRCAEIARRLVGDEGSDDAELHETLARACWEDAARRWERLRNR